MGKNGKKVDVVNFSTFCPFAELKRQTLPFRSIRQARDAWPAEILVSIIFK